MHKRLKILEILSTKSVFVLKESREGKKTKHFPWYSEHFCKKDITCTLKKKKKKTWTKSLTDENNLLQWLTAQISPTAKQHGLFVLGQGSKGQGSPAHRRIKQLYISFAVCKTELLTILCGWHQMFCSLIFKINSENLKITVFSG